MSTKGRTSIEIVEEVVIAGPGEKRHRYLQGIELLQNGDILVIYREGFGQFSTPPSVVRTTRSTDGGHTWSEPVTIVSEPGWSWSSSTGGLIQLSDGKLLAPLYRDRTERCYPDGRVQIDPPRVVAFFPEWHHSPPDPFPRRRILTNQMITSLDNGYTWTEPEETKVEVDYPLRFWVPYGRLHELADGRVMFPVCGGGLSAILFSSDGGETWTDIGIISDAPELGLSETDITRLKDGHWLALLRHNRSRPYYLYRSHSEDDGKTWTLARPTTIEGHDPGLATLPSGAVLCVYRDKRGAKKQGVSISISHDDGKTWEFVGQPIPDPGYTNDCAYPSMIHLPNGDVLCAFFTPFIEANSDIRGWFIREK